MLIQNETKPHTLKQHFDGITLEELRAVLTRFPANAWIDVRMDSNDQEYIVIIWYKEEDE
jgi:hypothetical protein